MGKSLYHYCFEVFVREIRKASSNPIIEKIIIYLKKGEMNELLIKLDTMITNKWFCIESNNKILLDEEMIFVLKSIVSDDEKSTSIK